MHLSILTPESLTNEIAEAPASGEDSAAEFEIVLGRRQLASVLFVGTVVVAVFSSLAYLTGKSVAAAPKIVPAPVPQATTAAPPAKIEAPQVKPAEPPIKAEARPEPPLFAEPVSGAVYLQLGAVEKGIAVIFAEGFRKRGFPAFVATGPNERIFRVLIGPLNSEAYERNKAAMDDLGLTSFARKYQQ